MEYPRRGEIWLVNLDPARGSEIRKTRPTCVISNDINNQFSGTITILPISDKGSKIYPYEVLIEPAKMGLRKPSKVRCQQIRTVDKSRFLRCLGTLEMNLLPQIEQALKIHLGIE